MHVISLRPNCLGSGLDQSDSITPCYCCRILAMSPPSSARGLTALVLMAAWLPQLQHVSCTARTAISSASASQLTALCSDSCKASNSTAEIDRCQQQCWNSEPAPRSTDASPTMHAYDQMTRAMTMVSSITPPWRRVVKLGCPASNPMWVKDIAFQHGKCLKERRQHPGQTMQFRYEFRCQWAMSESRRCIHS